MKPSRTLKRAHRRREIGDGGVAWGLRRYAVFAATLHERTPHGDLEPTKLAEAAHAWLQAKGLWPFDVAP